MSKLSFEGIKVVALNLNGILSDGTFLLSESNEGIRVSRRFSCKDLEVFQMLKQDYMTIITSATQDCNLVAKRIIKPHHALTSVKKKFHQLKLVLNHEGFSPDEVLYAGNSIYDIESRKLQNRSSSH